MKDVFNVILDGFVYGAIACMILFLIYRTIRNKLRKAAQRDLFIRHFKYENSTDIEKIKLCLVYWVKQNDFTKIEMVAKRLLDFDYLDLYANEEIVKAIYFNRKYEERNKVYFETINNHYKYMDLNLRKEKAIYFYLYSILLKQTEDNIRSKELSEFAFEIDPDLQTKFPEFFDK